MKIFFAESEYDVSEEFIRRYKTTVTKAFGEVSQILPFGSKHVNFVVQPRTYNLIDVSNDNGHAHNSELIEMAFNPTLDEDGIEKLLVSARAVVYHEMNHAARFHVPIYHKTFFDNCIFEGLGSAFERDYAGAKVLWAEYPDNVADWVEEIISLPQAPNWWDYAFRHPDGRRWMAYKIGTYIVDQAKQKSGKLIPDLTRLSGDEILRLAEIDVTKAEWLR